MTPGRLPESLFRYRVPAAVLARTRGLLRMAGERGFEAVVVWVGTIADEFTAEVGAAVAPRQVAYRRDDGCAVEVPPEEIGNLVMALSPGQFVLARVHTHPGAAYHSPVDDLNMLVGHVGAISVVVPDFAAAPTMNLAACSVNELRADGSWLELSAEAVRDRFEVLR